MSRETEKIFKDFNKYIEGKEFDSEEEVQKELAAFMENYNKGLDSNVKSAKKSADDYLDMAYNATSRDKAIEYAKKALKLDRDLVDARLLILQFEDDLESVKKQLEDLIKGETKRLEKEGYFTDDVGSFWGIIETRPYMRARDAYIEVLVEMGKVKKAVSECEDIIRLNENDNMGVRYQLMALYAYLEDADAAKGLYSKFKDDSYSMLFPMAVMHYKMDDLGKAGSTLKKIIKNNEDYRNYLSGELTLDKEQIDKIVLSGMYRQDTIEEVVMAIKTNSILADSVMYFNNWASVNI